MSVCNASYFQLVFKSKILSLNIVITMIIPQYKVTLHDATCSSMQNNAFWNFHASADAVEKNNS